MADSSLLTPGIQQSTVIHLNNSSGLSRSHIALVEYDWEPIGDVSCAIDGTLKENYNSERLLITLDMLLFANDDYAGNSELDTDYLLNDFLKDTGKQFKEDGWATYIDVVLNQNKVQIKPYKKKNALAQVKLKLSKKTTGLPTT